MFITAVITQSVINILLAVYFPGNKFGNTNAFKKKSSSDLKSYV